MYIRVDEDPVLPAGGAFPEDHKVLSHVTYLLSVKYLAPPTKKASFIYFSIRASLLAPKLGFQSPFFDPKYGKAQLTPCVNLKQSHRRCRCGSALIMRNALSRGT